MHYIGKLESDGSVFDQSKAPFQFKIGMAHVIRGWDEGIMKMSLGEKATLTITADFGYGARGLSLAPLARALEVLVVPVLVVSWDRGALVLLSSLYLRALPAIACPALTRTATYRVHTHTVTRGPCEARPRAKGALGKA